MDWVALDVETTGLVAGVDKVVELAAVTRSGRRFHTFVFNMENTYTCTPYVSKMHTRIWEALATITPVRESFILEGTRFTWEGVLIDTFQKWLEPTSAYTVAGKNVTFDLGFLRALGKVWCKTRVLDPAILYAMPDDEYLPDLSEVARRSGYGNFDLHTAMDDCLVVRHALLRAGF